MRRGRATPSPRRPGGRAASRRAPRGTLGGGRAGAMLTSRTFLKRTRAGAVVKVVREHYLRDDIPCGADACPLCPVRPGQPLGLEARPSGAASSLCPGPHYLLPDTNLLLHQVSASRPRFSACGRGWPWGSGCPQHRAGPSPCCLPDPKAAICPPAAAVRRFQRRPIWLAFGRSTHVQFQKRRRSSSL